MEKAKAIGVPMPESSKDQALSSPTNKVQTQGNIHINQRVLKNEGNIFGTVHNVYIYYSNPPAEEPTSPAVDLSKIGPNPYRGLNAFREQNSDYFFGREHQTTELWQTLKALYDHPSNIRFLPVYGPSGSGKSSLVRAGLLPFIGKHPLSGNEHTNVAILEPRSNPLEGLAIVLARMTTGDWSPIAKTQEQKTSDNRVYKLSGGNLYRLPRYPGNTKDQQSRSDKTNAGKHKGRQFRNRYFIHQIGRTPDHINGEKC